MAKLSVIVPVYNQDDIAVAHIKNCFDVEHVPDEVIVINDGGGEELRDKLAALKLPILYARINEDLTWNYNGACNLGAWLSTGDFLAYEDCDNIPNKTFYGNALAIFNQFPNIGRVQAAKRHIIPKEDLLTKLKKDWVSTGGMGANMGTAMFPRDIYLKLKGHDERFVGRYGWMYYDWRQRLLNRAKVEFSAIDFYYYIMDGQTDLPRSNSSQNLSYKRDNDREKRMQGPEGILNFTFTSEWLK